MAKKFVRGVTGVEDIESFDKTLTNVNDIVSDGQDTYVHTKKGKSESYYKLTDSVKQVESSDNSLTITKEDGTVSIANSGLATKEELAGKENVLSVDYGLSKTTIGGETLLSIEYTYVDNNYDLNELTNGRVTNGHFLNAPSANKWFFVSAFQEGNRVVQDAIVIGEANNTTYRRVKLSGTWGSWREQVGDKSSIDAMFSQKQNNLQSNLSIGVTSNNSLRQLYTLKQTYTHADGVLKTYIKSVTNSVNPEGVSDDEYNFLVKLNKGVSSVNFTLNSSDTNKFNSIITNYGSNNVVRISGCVFTLNGSTLTVSTANNTEQNYVISFTHII